MSFKYTILFVFSAVTCNGVQLTDPGEDHLSNCRELITKHGYSPVIHHVTTKDGYIIELYNIPGDKSKPLLLLHGVFDTSSGWFLRGNTSLGIMAADSGYDVWALNFRGNTYSRNHTTLNPDIDNVFWEYSAHEFGSYDLPAAIDFILEQTGQEQLSIAGFSEGTTAVFILGSTRPEYNDKVNMFVALAPVAHMEHVRPALSHIIGFSPFLDFILPKSVQEISGYRSTSKAILNVLCTQLAVSYELCYQGGMSAVSGPDSDGIERNFMPKIFQHFPAGTSRKNLMHFAKISLGKSFSQYDYGAAKNMQVYNCTSPPAYDLSRVTIRTALVCGENDPVSTVQDVERLARELPNVVWHDVIRGYNHLDQVWARDAHERLYGLVLDLLHEYS